MSVLTVRPSERPVIDLYDLVVHVIQGSNKQSAALHFKCAVVMRLTGKWDMQNMKDGYCVKADMASLLNQPGHACNRQEAGSKLNNQSGASCWLLA
jgi:hypothetical protein